MGKEFDKAVSLTELCRAIKECRKGVSYKDGPTDWYIHRLTKAEALQREILKGKYKLRPGTVVKIYRPKKREAIAPWFKDRVWQRSMCNNGVYRDLTKSLCYDNYACQKGKGTDVAIRRTIKFLKKIYCKTGSNEGWAVHIDVRKYFPSTPQKLLLEMDQKKISEPLFCPYLAEVVKSVNDKRTPEEIEKDAFGKRGTGLGSQINQLHQVALLDQIDHEIATFCKSWQRYMDDYLILDSSKEVCEKARDVIEKGLKMRGLEPVEMGGIQKISNGFYFLRHFFLLTNSGKVIVKLHPTTAKTERAALRGMKSALERKKISMEQVRQHYQCFIANAEYSNCESLIRSMEKFYTSIFKEKPKYKRKRRYLHGGQHQKSANCNRSEKSGGAGGATGKGKGEGAIPGAPGG